MWYHGFVWVSDRQMERPMKVRQRIVALILEISLIMTGCGMRGGKSKSETNYISQDPVHFTGMCDAEAVIAYDIPKQLPNILVNCVGYEKDGEKKILFRSAKATGQFWVVDTATGQPVYKGTVPSGRSGEQTGESVSMADISAVSEPGEYIICNDGVGESYSFIVGENIRNKQLTEEMAALQESLQEDMRNDTYKAGKFIRMAEQMIHLFAAYDFFPERFTDHMLEEYSGNGIPDLLDMAENIAGWFLTLQDKEITPDEQMAFAGVLAKFCQIYKEFDNSKASAYGKTAAELYKLARQETEEIATSIGFYAAVTLYEMQGNAKYRTDIKAYGDAALHLKEMDAFYLFGNVNYVSGKRSVEIARCSRFMSELMTVTEAGCVSCRRNEYKVCDPDGEQIIRNMSYLVIANYVLESEEYHSILENHYHYLCGCNPEAEVMRGAMDRMRAPFILFLCGLMDGES